MENNTFYRNLNEAATGDSPPVIQVNASFYFRNELNSDWFSYIFRNFLMYFSMNGKYIYRNMIRQLNSYNTGIVSTKSDRSLNTTSYKNIPLLPIDLEHFAMPHWIKELEENLNKPNALFSSQECSKQLSENFRNPESASLQEVLQIPISCWGEYLTYSFKHFPLKALSIAESVTRNLYFDILFPVKPRNLNEQYYSDETPPVPLSLSINTFALRDMNINSQADIIQSSNLQLTNSCVFQLELISRQLTQPIRTLTAQSLETLIVTQGIVIQTSTPQHKAVRIKIKCKQCDSERFLAVPLWKESASLPRYCAMGGNVINKRDDIISTSSVRCPIDPYIILSDESQYCDVQEIKVQELHEDVPTGDMPRHIILNAANALSGRVSPGQRILIVGVHTTAQQKKKFLVKQMNNLVTGTGYIHVLGLEIINSASIERSLNGSFPLAHIPYNSVEYSQERYYQLLASDPEIYQKIFLSIAPSIYGLESLKKSIACLLFGGSRKCLQDGTKLRGDINILLLGDPSTAKSQFLKFVEKVAPTVVYTSGKGSSAAGLTAAVIRDSNGNFALEGGAMVLADGGVVCIDEFDKMRDDDRVSIHEAMEQQTISIAKAGITTVLTTKCSVLAAANPTFGSYDDTKETADQHDFETTILSRFDLIWLLRDIKDTKKDQSVAKHIIQLHLNIPPRTGNEPILPIETLKGYINYCRSHCTPTLSQEAAKRLENYYVEVRERMRQSGYQARDCIPITVRQLESLSRIAQSYAKMSLAQYVTVEHIEEAIHLFDSSTVQTAQSSVERIRYEESLNNVRLTENAILHRLPLNARASKYSIVKELQCKGISQRVISKALDALIHKGILEERGDASVRRMTVTS